MNLPQGFLEVSREIFDSPYINIRNVEKESAQNKTASKYATFAREFNKNEMPA